MANPLHYTAPLFLLSFLAFLLTTSSSSSPLTQTYIIRVLKSSKPSIYPTHSHWYTSGFLSSTSNDDNVPTLLHTYSTVFHGFSARLTPTQATSLLTHPSILSIIPDRLRQLHTTRSPQFLGLRLQRGLWSESDYGSDVIIGILDTGIWPERRSFSDKNLGPIPSKWKGTCQTGENFTLKSCNRKIVGARYFSKGHESAFPGISGGGINSTIEYKSARDADGHGTHTASTAAGRYAFAANMSGYASGVAKGVAPKARLAVYKVCWKSSGCFDSDILAAFDAAVADGVDVISISIGGGDGISSPYYLDPIAIGSYGAVSRGVFVASSAGNDGPGVMSVTNLAPWLMTVGAGTIDRNFPAEVVLGDGRRVSGVSLYSGKPLKKGKMYPIIYPGKTGALAASLCMENSLEPKEVKGRIVICDRGSNPRVAKGLVVKKAGGVGMILVNGATNGEGLVGDAHLIPALAVGAKEGDLIKTYLENSSKAVIVTGTINFQGTLIGVKPAPVVAAFSGRGPNGLNPEILKPDLIAPGVNILAAWTDAVGPSGLDVDSRKIEFSILSGTSMSCPHVGGAAALLKSAHPDWTPAMIKSAMMTTANLFDNRGEILTDESTGKASRVYDMGAGHLNLDRAMDPGLVYDLNDEDYVRFLCGIGYGVKTIQVITGSPADCGVVKGKAAAALPENFNYPSVVAVLPAANKGVVSKSFERTVTNVGGDEDVVYEVEVGKVGRGVTLDVNPRKLVFSAEVKRLSFEVVVAADVKRMVLGDDGALFGSFTWSDSKKRHLVRSPVVVTQAQPVM